nr:MAG TPA: hypothetical protein [Caudoviricetes sp.]
MFVRFLITKSPLKYEIRSTLKSIMYKQFYICREVTFNTHLSVIK